MPRNLARSLVQRPVLRWLVPALVLFMVVGAGTAGRIMTADASTSLPRRTAAQLLVDVQTAESTELSGTVVQKSDLGLTSLTTGSARGSSEFSSLLTGSHTLRVWYGGRQQQRVALLGSLGESDVVRNGLDLWTWSSRTNTAAHRKLTPDTQRDRPDATATPSTPAQAAAEALAAISPTTKVSTDGTGQVAGRPVYELVLAPKDKGARIGQVRIAIDSAKKVPLRVRVYARGASTPAFEVGFTQISFTRPDAAEFTFTPPPGVKVTQQQQPKDAASGQRDSQATKVIGSGWTSVVTTTVPKGNSAMALLGSAPRVSGTWGSGRLITSALVCALLTDDGRLIAGAVDPARLYQVAAR